MGRVRAKLTSLCLAVGSVSYGAKLRGPPLAKNEVALSVEFEGCGVLLAVLGVNSIIVTVFTLVRNNASQHI